MQVIVYLLTFAILIAKAASDDAELKPVVIGPSEYFEGNDGPWSTFNIRVGTPEQDVRVIVSTASPESMVVVAESGCSTSVFSTVPPNCAVSRGNLFDMNKTFSWRDMGVYGINQNGVGFQANLGYSQRAQFGLEHLGIGLTGPGLDNQTVAGIATPEPFYLGLLGLNNQPVNFSTMGNYSSPSLLTTLKDQKKIPSMSWSYTAGAKYRLKQVYGQLIFSGYDKSRFKENSVSFTMAGDVTRDLVVALQSISYSGSSSATLLSQPINIFIDSTDPKLWLPGDVCDAFEKAFGLTLDNESQLYLVNDTHHNALLNSGAEVTFRISDVKAGGDTVPITLPYAAFDLEAGYPLVGNSSHYFPLRRASNSTQYTLGRTFLQEAYLSADYERKVFNVSACVWKEGAQEEIVAIDSKDGNSGAGSGGSGGSHLSGGAIAGIVVGCVALAILIIAAGALVVLRQRRRWIGKGFAVAAPKKEPDDSVLKDPVFNATPPPMSETSPTPWSADDVTPPKSTGVGGSSSAGDSSTRHGSGSGSGGGSGSGTSGTTPELAGPDVNPPSKADGGSHLAPVAENPGIYELPGSAVSLNHSREGLPEQAATTGDTLALPKSRHEGNLSSPSSPLVSTLGSTWGQDDRTDAELVSPISPTRR